MSARRWFRKRRDPYSIPTPSRRQRCLDADFDAFVAMNEHEPELLAYDGSDPYVLLLQHNLLVDAGLLDPDEPTHYNHYEYQRIRRSEFTPLERAALRELILLPVEDGDQP